MKATPRDGARVIRPAVEPARADGPYWPTLELPPHLAGWQLPPEWRWGAQGVRTRFRHFQEVVDALGRSLSLVSAPDISHAPWLAVEARHLAHRNHPSIPTTYHYWTLNREARRGPGYLRRWIGGETVGARVRRGGLADVPFVMQLLRAAGSTLAYLHDTGMAHGAFSPDTVWATPAGRIWLLGWQWVVPPGTIPPGVTPDWRWTPSPPEWQEHAWMPTPASDQWQLAATCFAALTGEMPPPTGIPPIALVRPECPQAVASALDRALSEKPEDRHRSISALLRSLERGSTSRSYLVAERAELPPGGAELSEEARLRWAVGDDYDVLARLGAGTFGTVWRVRDLALEREVALKMLHPGVANDEDAVARFRQEARLAAQLAHPAIVPIYDWDSRGGVSWYTMELAENGSVAELVARSGPRSFADIAPQVDQVLDALIAAHASGIIHRDLKPENILIDRYRRWRVTDFGIARVTGIEAGGTTGTPAFAAPEQLLGEPQGPAVDCFALAAIIAFVLSGDAPFGDVDGPTVLARQLSGQLDLTVFAPDIAAWLRRGLATDPDSRFTDAAAMQQAWRQLMQARGTSERRRTSWWTRVLGG